MANSKKKNYYYVMVLTNNGPAFVTKIDYSDKSAYWDKQEKPLTMSKSEAENLSFGLKMNFHMAFMITNEYELDSQPYLYNKGHFEWIDNEKQETENK